MPSRSRLQLAMWFLAAIVLVMVIMALFFSRTECANAPDCVLLTFASAGGVLFFLLMVAAELAHRPAIRTIRQLREAASRAAAGEFRYPVFTPARGEVGELAHMFGHMVEQLSRRVSALEEERRQLSVMAEYMANGALIADEDGYVEMVNPEAARLLNIDRSTSVGRTIAEVMRHHQLIDLWQRSRASRTEQIEAVEIGKELFLQVAITPFQQMETGGFLVNLLDLTRVRHLETVRRDFISNLSHELRTPLASLRAVVETLQAGAIEDRPAAERFLERAEREVDTMTHMVRELLELSLIESGQVPLKLVATELNDLLLVPLERLQPQAGRGKVELALNLPPGLPLVLADSERLQQVVSNLLHNAIKFTAPGGRITVSAHEEKGPDESVGNRLGSVIIAVKDTGIGISNAEAARIFERFYKSDRARTRGSGGTGLGLAIARHIVQAHDGEIWVKSKEGKGSTFYFSLPAVAHRPGT